MLRTVARQAPSSRSSSSTALPCGWSRNPSVRANRSRARGVGRHRGRRPGAVELEGVLDPAEEAVAGAQPAGVAGVDVAAVGQRGERRHGAPHPQRRVVAAVDELEQLGGELDVADATAAPLELRTVPAA